MVSTTLDAVRVSSEPQRCDPGPLTLDAPSISMAAYFRMFSPGPGWSDLLDWPTDVFAFTSLVLHHTEAYRFAVAPPAGRRWPPAPGWNDEVSAAAFEWRISAAMPLGSAPATVRRLWDVVERHLKLALDDIRRGCAPEVWEALLTLHAIADEACAGLATATGAGDGVSFEQRAWEMLAERGSLSRVAPTRIHVTPKTHFAGRGITIRSFSRYLALSYQSIDVEWRRIEPEIRSGRARREHREYNIVLAPWPLRLTADAFRPVPSPIDNLDHEAFGFFEYAPRERVDLTKLAELVRAAQREVRIVDTVVFPEGAVAIDEIEPIERVLGELGVTSMFAGVRDEATTTAFGRNFVHLGVNTSSGWQHYAQSKHHRWNLDGRQIHQYHLGRALDPSKQWWEAIDLPARAVQIFDIGGGTTIAPLVCEDLARMDEVADLLRGIGPSLVMALLLDGPQLPTRWPGRYATVLADEPGSAVLTLTSYGMVARSRPPGHQPSRVVGLWSDPSTGLHQLTLERGALGVLLTAAVDRTTVWTADGRRHQNSTPSLELSRVRQLRPERQRATVQP
jgi:hypothetical protein